MERFRIRILPESVILVTGLLIIVLVAIQTFLVQAAFEPELLLNAGTNPRVLQGLMRDRSQLLTYGGVLVLLVLAIFVGLALLLIRQRRTHEHLNSELERQVGERTAQLRLQETQYRRIVETAHEGILMAGADNKITYVNPRGSEILGAPSQDLLGKDIFELVPVDNKQQGAEGLQTLDSNTGHGDYPIRRKSGQEAWVLWSGVAYQDDASNHQGSLFMLTDITERKHVEAALESNEKLYRSLVEIMPQCVFRKDRDGRITFGNSRFWNAIGLPENEGLGKTDFDYSPRALAEKYRQDDLAVMETGETVEMVEDFKPPDGPLQIIRVIKSPVRDHLGNIEGVQVMFWDITEGRRQGELLRERQELLTRVLETVEGGIYITDRTGALTFTNPATERMLGATRQEILGTTYNDPRWQFATEDGLPFPDAEQPFRRVLDTGKPVHEVLQTIRRADGAHVIVSINAAPLRDAQGEIVGEVASVTDITKRTDAENSLRRQNEYLDALHQTTIGLVGRLDRDDLLNAITQRAANLAGTAHGYIYLQESGVEKMSMRVGIGSFAQMIGTDAEKGVGATGTVWETGEPLVIDDYQEWSGHLSKPGSFGLQAVLAIPLKSNNEVVGVFGLAYLDAARKFDQVAVDVFTRFAHLAAIALNNARLFDAAQQEIIERKSAEEKFKKLFDASPDAIVLIDPNQPTWPIVDCNNGTGEMNGYTRAELIGQSIDILNIEPGTAPERAKYLAEIKRHGILRLEAEHRHKDGHLFTVETSTTLIRVGDSELVLGIDRDVTKRKEVDRMKTEFISTVSHELRTPLTSIRGSLGLIAGGVAGQIPDRAKSMVDIAYKNSERLVRLINDILDVEKIESGKMEFQFKPIELVPLIEQAIEANRAFGEQYQVSFALVSAAPDLKINADADRITQVLTNLLSNAAKFSPPGGQVEIRAEAVGENVRVSVQDHGNGIPNEFKSRIFQKFAQADSSDTRQKGGTGLGLSIVKAIVEKHGGTIGFDTQDGLGTTFYVELPAYHQVPAPPPLQALYHSRILILEDDHDVAALLQIMLAREGFEADVAYDCAGAWKLLQVNTYAALTLDLLLPHDEGVAFIRELRAGAKTHDLPIVVVSAKADQGAIELNGDAMWVADWLQKPIDQKKLVKAVALAARGVRVGKPRILHVEDDRDVVQVVAAILDDLADVTPATTVAEAHALLEQNSFDLVILDAVLPDGSGLDLLSSLRRTNSRMPVVIFSATENDAFTASQVNAALVKARTSNEQLMQTIAQLIPARVGENRE